MGATLRPIKTTSGQTTDGRPHKPVCRQSTQTDRPGESSCARATRSDPAGSLVLAAGGSSRRSSRSSHGARSATAWTNHGANPQRMVQRHAPPALPPNVAHQRWPALCSTVGQKCGAAPWATGMDLGHERHITPNGAAYGTAKVPPRANNRRKTHKRSTHQPQVISHRSRFDCAGPQKTAFAVAPRRPSPKSQSAHAHPRPPEQRNSTPHHRAQRRMTPHHKTVCRR